ncbi:MAG: hypothetical protein IT424_07775 [Pirellulales bacterium]|nr:hypothetical protein [Pirellulales bacterium]
MRAFLFIFAYLLPAGALISPAPTYAAVAYSTVGEQYGEDFDSLSSLAMGNLLWTNDATLPGWSLFNAAGGALASIRASGGTDTVGSFYSFGATGADRALGGVAAGNSYFGAAAEGTVAGYISVAITNATGVALDSFSVSFNGEQWRDAPSAAPQTMVFQYGFGAAYADVSWTVPGGFFDWTGPVSGSSTRFIYGNQKGLVSNRGGLVAGVDWAAGQTLWLRWTETNDAGLDHGLAIDDFSLTAFAATSSAVPEASSLLALAALSAAAIARVLALRTVAGVRTRNVDPTGEHR